MKQCTRCREHKPLQAFSKDKYRADGYQYTCRQCKSDLWIERTYGITREVYDSMLATQKGACAICLRGFTGTIHVDHCHTGGHVRGLLCPACNKGLGHFEDNTEALQRAVEYLK